MNKERRINKNFKDLKSFSDIVDVMVKGLENEWVSLKMQSFGGYREKKFLGITYKKVCYGCAATNVLCELRGKTIKPSEIDNRVTFFNEGITEHELSVFESIIDNLRLGRLICIENLAIEISYLFPFDILKDLRILLESAPQYMWRELPVLEDDYTKEDLQQYKDFSKKLKQIGL